MLKRIWIGALLAIAPLPAQAEVPAGPERHFTARDLFDLKAYV